MSSPRKRSCCVGRHWFGPDPRVGARQRVCSKADCRASWRQRTQANWRRRNPGYAIADRIDQRAAQTEPPPEGMRVPAPLNQLPWEFAKDQFGPQRADFIGVMGALMVRTAKDEFRAYLIDPTRLSGTVPPSPQKTSPGLGHSEPAGDDATGVSPTRTALGTSARPPTCNQNAYALRASSALYCLSLILFHQHLRQHKRHLRVVGWLPQQASPMCRHRQVRERDLDTCAEFPLGIGTPLDRPRHLPQVAPANTPERETRWQG